MNDYNLKNMPIFGDVLNAFGKALKSTVQTDGSVTYSGRVEEQKRAVAEDNVNGVFAIADKKLPEPDYTADFGSNYGANVTANIKSSAGNLFAIWGDNNNAAVRYLQAHDTAGTPSGGAVPKIQIPVPAGSVVSIGESVLGAQGVHFSNGIAFAWSTTDGTYTAATATDHNTFYRYK
jgi:hypothetical protein